MKVMFPDNPFQSKTVLTKEIPINIYRKKAKTHKPILPHQKWKTVKVGQSWTVPNDRKRLVYHAACTHGWRYDKKFSYKLQGDLMKITRVK